MPIYFYSLFPKILSMDWIVRRGKYLFDRRVFVGVLAVLVLVVILAAVQTGGRRTFIYVHCDSIRTCENPLYENPDVPLSISQVQTLEPGSSLGAEPGFFLKYSSWLMFSVVAFGFFLNHVMHNKKVLEEARK